MKKTIKIISVILLILLIGGWGAVGHRIINQKSVEFFPQQLAFLNWSQSLAAHASDADNRKGSDPSESPKHFIDIDAYPEFVANGKISQSFDSVVAKHGLRFVEDTGILPWAILATVDSLTNAFKDKNWDKAVLIAADLGHYVGDSHMPLHITENYNGQLSNQSGIHSRYESKMISKFESEINYEADNIVYVNNLSEFVFTYIYSNYQYVDSVLQADKAAAAFAGNNSSDIYYNKLWELTNGFTLHLFHNASQILADLIYTAYVNAGNPNELPVELVNFNSSVSSNEVALNWTTASELNNSGFVIERKSENGNFIKIGFVKGKGTTAEVSSYNFSDKIAEPGIYKYRLKQVNFDGSFEYSKITEIKFDGVPKKFGLNQNYPNPFNPSTSISYELAEDSHVTLFVYNSLGMKVAELLDKNEKEGNYSIKFKAEKLSSGIYYYRLTAGNFSEVKKMLLLK